MEVLQKIFQGKIITQEDYNNLIKKGYEKLKNPTLDEKMEFRNTLSGGECRHCGKNWKLQYQKTNKFDYKYYIPDCDCLIKISREKNYIIKENQFNQDVQIPEKYHKVRIKDLDLKIKKETLKSIEQIKKYYETKTYKNFGLIIYGDIGVGKTHIAIAIMKAIYITERMQTGLFLHMSEFLNKIIKSKEDVINKIMRNNIILLDDIDKANISVEKENDWINEQVFSLINGLTVNNKIILGTSNLESADEFARIYDNAIFSRLIESCKFINIKGDDYRLKKRGLI